MYKGTYGVISTPRIGTSNAATQDGQATSTTPVVIRLAEVKGFNWKHLLRAEGDLVDYEELYPSFGSL